MDTTLPSPSDFQRIFHKVTASNSAALVASINAQLDFWLKNLKALQESYTKLTALNTTLTTTNTELVERVNALEGVDEELVNARKLVKKGQDALNQALRAHNLCKNQNTELTKQLQLAQLSNSILTVAPVQARPSPNHPDSDKFNGDKTKLEAFVTQLRIKLQQNADYFIRSGQNTEQNQLSYAISRLEGDAFIQIEPYISWNGIDLSDIAALEKLLETRFGEINPVGTAKHELYRLYQANKDLEVFLNTFLMLAKKAKLEESQILDLLYKKLSDEFKNLLVTKKKQTNLADLIKKLRSMDVSMKIINQQKRAAPVVNTKPTQQTTRFVPQPTRFAAAAPTTVTTSSTLPTSLFSTATGTHAGPIDMSSVRRGPLTTEEKEQRNKLGLCRYCGQPGHIAMDHKDLNILLAKRRAAGIHEMTIALSNTALSSNTTSENTPSPSTVALGDLLD